MYKEIVRPLLFKQDAEKVHQATLKTLKIFEKYPSFRYLLTKTFEYHHPKLEINLWGLNFKNPIGLAAGFDKDAEVVEALSSLGFGSLEVGTVTVLPQPGNPRPAIVRLEKDQALINQMGFPNKGVKQFAQNLSSVQKENYILGINIGKGKDTPLPEAGQDYALLIENLFVKADYITVNISSPNTAGLRKLQSKEELSHLLDQINEANLKASQKRNLKPLPILVKIAPDLSWLELDNVLEIMVDKQVDGLIATNTTINRPDNLQSNSRKEPGGLSGQPLKFRSTKIINYAFRRTKGKMTIVGGGGIFSYEDALEKIKAGASLVQLYTGLVYQGPFVVKQLKQNLAKYLEANGISSIKELIGQESL